MPQPKVYLRAAAKILGFHKSSKARRKSSSTSSSDEEEIPSSPSFSHSNGRRLSLSHRFYFPPHARPRSQALPPTTVPQYPSSDYHKQYLRHSTITPRYHLQYPSKETVTLRRRATVLGNIPSSSTNISRSGSMIGRGGSSLCRSGSRGGSRSSSPQPLVAPMSTLYPYPLHSSTSSTSLAKLYRRSGHVSSPPLSSSSSSASYASSSSCSLHRSKSAPNRERRLKRQSAAFDTLLLHPNTLTQPPIITTPSAPTRPRSPAIATEIRPTLTSRTSSKDWQQTNSTPMVQPDSQTGAGTPANPSLPSSTQNGNAHKISTAAQSPTPVLERTSTSHPHHGSKFSTSTAATATATATQTNAAATAAAPQQPTAHCQAQDVRDSSVQQDQPRQPSSPVTTLAAALEGAENSTQLLRLRQTSQVVAAASAAGLETTATVPAAEADPLPLRPVINAPHTHHHHYHKPAMPALAEKGRLPQRPTLLTRHSSVTAMSLCSTHSWSSSWSKKSGGHVGEIDGEVSSSDHNSGGGCCSMSIQTFESEQSQLEATLRHHSDILPTVDEMMAKVGHCLASEDDHRGAQLVDRDAARAVVHCVEVVHPSQISIVEPCSAKIETWIN